MFVDNDQQCFAFTPQANFPTHNLIFTEGDRIESLLPFKIFSTLKQNVNFANNVFFDKNWTKKVKSFFQVSILSILLDL